MLEMCYFPFFKTLLKHRIEHWYTWVCKMYQHYQCFIGAQELNFCGTVVDHPPAWTPGGNHHQRGSACKRYTRPHFDLKLHKDKDSHFQKKKKNKVIWWLRHGTEPRHHRPPCDVQDTVHLSIQKQFYIL